MVFLDLHGLGLFPQWVVLPGPFFNSAEYLEGILQAPTVEGWTIVVEGGELLGDGTTLKVKDGETLNIFLQETSDLTPSNDTDSGDEGDESDGFHDSDVTDPLPGSSDWSTSPPPDDGRPRGPPSMSQRREAVPPGVMVT